MRILTAAVCFGAAFALAASSAQGLGIPGKMKAKKVQGDLVPAFAPADTGSGTGDDENDDPAILDTPVLRGACTFLKGKFKAQVGKEVKVKMIGVECGGTSYTGQLCAHTKTLSTIMDENIDKKGVSTPKTCLSPAGANTENTVQWVTGSIGMLTCVDGKCDGTLADVTNDPCPDVDKVNEIRRVEVFDGPDKGSLTISGATIAACCGPTQTVAGGLSVSAVAPCTTSTQDVMAEMGTVLQGVE